MTTNASQSFLSTVFHLPIDEIIHHLKNDNKCKICGKDLDDCEFSLCMSCWHTMSDKKCEVCGKNLYNHELIFGCCDCRDVLEAEAEYYGEDEDDYESKLKTITFLHEAGSTIEEMRIVTKLTEEEIRAYLDQEAMN